ncbi:MAG: PD-(D/E)XK nuclease family protein [Candidatus Omnitrophica bacterium]|nr:PD-(D/E)XK nuclease family protein [Candidatus Omnitrophota bacterium]
MPIYSHSRLGKFEGCPLSYKFSYIDKIKSEKEGIEAFMGSQFHGVMEKLYQECSFKVCSLSELFEYYESLWEKNWHPTISITKSDMTAENYRQKGRKFIEDYYRRYRPFNQSHVLGVERKVNIKLDDSGEYKFRGVIDRLDKAEDGIYEIHDYKTNKYLPTQADVDQDRQLALYQIAIQEAWPNDTREVRLIWHYVAHDQEMRSSRTPEELTQLKADTVQLIKKIESTTEFLPNQNYLCNWCGYQNICPLFKHQFAVESLPPNEYLNDDGVKLVNTYAGFYAQKQEHAIQIKGIEAELEKVEEAVVAYSKKENASIIVGSDKQLKISEKETIKYPGKNDPGRTQLNEIIKETGKWEELSCLDTYALTDALLSNSIPPEQTARIEGLVEKIKNIKVSLSKKKEDGDD